MKNFLLKSPIHQGFTIGIVGGFLHGIMMYFTLGQDMFLTLRMAIISGLFTGLAGTLLGVYAMKIKRKEYGLDFAILAGVSVPFIWNIYIGLLYGDIEIFHILTGMGGGLFTSSIAYIAFVTYLNLLGDKKKRVKKTKKRTKK